MQSIPNDQAKQKQEQLIERARKGLLKHIHDNGGKCNLGQMHEFCMNKFFIQHQAFSKLMEGLVADGLLMYDFGSDEATLTPQGQDLALKS